MKRIIKNPPPRIYKDYCKKPEASFDGDGFPKELLRQSLLVEQGYICCYCMRKIPESKYPHVKIEHYRCRDTHKELTLNYNNLFAACTGFETLFDSEKTCDTKKNNSLLTLDLLTQTPNCDYLFQYNSEGEIKAKDNSSVIYNEINQVLNLNMSFLKIGRQQTYLLIQNKVKKKLATLKKKEARFKFCSKLKDEWLSKQNGKYREYCMVAVYYLEKKMKEYS